MSESVLLVEERGAVLWLTVNRPSKLNALNAEVVAALERAADRAEESSSVHAVVVTGMGERAFVAGADIAELSTLGPVAAKELALRGQALCRRIERLPKPVVAAVNGFALGGGCELAMACHLRVASSTAVFGQPEVKLGLIPGYGGTQRLARLVGRGRALELLMTGRNLNADEAERIGLVNAVVEPSALVAKVESLLDGILANGPLAVAHCIEAVNHGLDMALDDALLLEATLFAVCAASPQMKEGTAAFLEKRKADFWRAG